MRRHEISDALWAQIQPLVPRQGRPHDSRTFVNAVVYQAKTGIHWRDMPPRFGNWNSIHRRFSRWAKKGIWEQIFALTADPDPVVIMVDSTTVRANQVAAGQKKAKPGQSVWVVHVVD